VAQPVVGGLVGHEGVVDVAAGAQAGLQRGGHALGGGAADLGVGGQEARERDVERDGLGLVGQRDLERRDLLGEQPRPGARAGDGLLREDLLLGLGEQVRAVPACGAQEVARRVEALGGQELLGPLVVQRGPLELEEDQLRLQASALLLHALEERAVGGILRVDGEAQRGEVARAAGQVGDGLQLGDGLGEPGPVQLGHAPGVALGEDRGALAGLLEEPVGACLTLAADERLEVPCDVGDGHAPQAIRRPLSVCARPGRRSWRGWSRSCRR
jgi:hypothetical protein